MPSQRRLFPLPRLPALSISVAHDDDSATIVMIGSEHRQDSPVMWEREAGLEITYQPWKGNKHLRTVPKLKSLHRRKKLKHRSLEEFEQPPPPSAPVYMSPQLPALVKFRRRYGVIGEFMAMELSIILSFDLLGIIADYLDAATATQRRKPVLLYSPPGDTHLPSSIVDPCEIATVEDKVRRSKLNQLRDHSPTMQKEKRSNLFRQAMTNAWIPSAYERVQQEMDGIF